LINSGTRHVSSRGIPCARTETNLTAIPCSSAPRTSTPQLHLDAVYPLSSSRADQGVQCFLYNVYESWIVHLLRVTVCSLGVRGFSENGCSCVRDSNAIHCGSGRHGDAHPPPPPEPSAYELLRARCAHRRHHPNRSWPPISGADAGVDRRHGRQEESQLTLTRRRRAPRGVPIWTETA